MRTGVAIGCNRMASDEQTGRLVCVILPVEPLLDTQTGLLGSGMACFPMPL